jgi:ectoine hydroxylase-related dioxygenase (phytanoyl-CoA dioxygenase family)
MNSTLTSNQIESYRENGFVIQHDFLTPSELEEWREAVGDAVGGRGWKRLPTEDGTLGAPPASDDYYGNVFIQRINLWMDNPRVRALMLDPRIGKMAADLEGVDGIRVWHDQTLIKEPWGNPTGWHLDNPYWSFSSRHAISIWIALDDATLENGCLFFLPGTHKLATFDNSGIGPNMNALFKVYPQWVAMKSVAAPMKAGSCSFHNGLTAHGATANMTQGYRRAMTCAFMPDGATFNGIQNVLSKEQVARLAVGDVLNDEAQNPLVYHRERDGV